MPRRYRTRSASKALMTRVPAYTRAYASRPGYTTARRRTYQRAAYGARKYSRGSSARASLSAKQAFAIGMSSARIHPCAITWFKSLMDPFAGPAEACNPFLPPVFSSRNRTWVRRPLSLTNYTGSVTQTAVLILQASPATDNAFLSVSGTGAWAFADPFTSYMGSSVGGSSYLNNSQFKAADFVSTSRFATVSMGLRVKYIGTNDAMGGMIGVFEPAGHDNLTSAQSNINSVRADPRYKLYPMSREGVTIMWSGPMTQAEYTYSNLTDTPVSDNLYLGGDPASVALYMDIQVPDIAQQVYVEAFLNFEVTGDKARGVVYSDYDATGGNTLTGRLYRFLGGLSLGGQDTDRQNMERNLLRDLQRDSSERWRAWAPVLGNVLVRLRWCGCCVIL